MNHLPPITEEGTWTQPAKHGRVLEYLSPDRRRVQVRLWTFAEGVINGQPADLPCPMADEEVHGLLLGALERTAEARAEKGRQEQELLLNKQGFVDIEQSPLRESLASNDGGTLGTTCPTIRRVLFLDVDGVLNTRPGALDVDKLNLLRHLVIVSGASVVVSSSWRTVPEQYERLIDALAGVEIMPIGCTPDLTIKKGELHLSKDRWQEIEGWLQENLHVDQCVILDDLPSMGPLSAYHIKTFPEFGLTHLDIMAAMLLFDKQAQAKGDRGPWMPAQAGKEAA